MTTSNYFHLLLENHTKKLQTRTKDNWRRQLQLQWARLKWSVRMTTATTAVHKDVGNRTRSVDTFTREEVRQTFQTFNQATDINRATNCPGYIQNDPCDWSNIFNISWKHQFSHSQMIFPKETPSIFHLPFVFRAIPNNKLPFYCRMLNLVLNRKGSIRLPFSLAFPPDVAQDYFHHFLCGLC